MPPERPRERRHHRDRYKPYRRSYLTPSERPSPFTYADELYEKLRRQLRRSVREEIEDDVQEFLNIISPSELVRSSGDNVSCMYVCRRISRPSHFETWSHLQPQKFVYKAQLIVADPRCTGIRGPSSNPALICIIFKRLLWRLLCRPRPRRLQRR